jgi:Zn-dependent alcohol dehydrogenase
MALGHEGAGVVEAVGEEVTHIAPGNPVGFCKPESSPATAWP